MSEFNLRKKLLDGMYREEDVSEFVRLLRLEMLHIWDVWVSDNNMYDKNGDLDIKLDHALQELYGEYIAP